MKRKVTSVHAMKAYGGNRGIALLVPNLGARWGWMIIVTPRRLYSRGRTLVPTEESKYCGSYFDNLLL